MLRQNNFVIASPHKYAVYLPAVNTTYPKIIDTTPPTTRQWPAGLTLDDLAFWSGNSQLFNHLVLLHSIGGYKIGSDPRGILFRKQPGEYITVGDCGGFQIGKGTLKGLKGLRVGMSGDSAVAAWGRNYEAKMWIINWLEQYCDYAMTIDMPLWATAPVGINSPFHKCSTQQLIDMTVANLQLIDRERQWRTKWLNVVQGTNEANTLLWWNAVKWFKGGGWSLAGAAGWRGGLVNVLKTLLIMREEGAFSKGQNWLHMLGVSQPLWDIVLSAIQRQLRKENPRIQVSFDSASAFESAGARDQYAIPPKLGMKTRDWTISYKTFTALRSDADKSKSTRTDLKSPIAKLLRMRDMVVVDKALAGRRIDQYTNAFLMNHNVYVYLEAGRRANALAFEAKTPSIPKDFQRVLAVIEEAFMVKDWRKCISNNSFFLNTIAKSSYD